MAERKPPETSTVRSALAALGSIEDALEVRNSREVRLKKIAEAIRAARELRPHQLDELLEHLDSRVGADEYATIPYTPPDGETFPEDVPPGRSLKDGELA